MEVVASPSVPFGAGVKRQFPGASPVIITTGLGSQFLGGHETSMMEQDCTMQQRFKRRRCLRSDEASMDAENYNHQQAFLPFHTTTPQQQTTPFNNNQNQNQNQNRSFAGNNKRRYSASSSSSSSNEGTCSSMYWLASPFFPLSNGPVQQEPPDWGNPTKKLTRFLFSPSFSFVDSFPTSSSYYSRSSNHPRDDKGTA